MSTNAEAMNDLIYAVSKQDKVNQGVAKARLAGEAICSVPSIERLMRGERASADIQGRILVAAKKRGLKFDRDQLFPPEKGKKRQAS